MPLAPQFEELLEFWGIMAAADWHPLQDNVFRIALVDGRQFVLKDLGPKNEETIRRLHFEYDVLHHVEQTGLSVALPLLSAEGTPYIVHGGHIWRLSHWLPNQAAEVQTSGERRRLYQNYGAAIARFHQALASYKDDDLLARTWQTDLQTRVLDEAVPVILAHLGPSLLPSFRAQLAEIEPVMAAAFANLPTQLIIWDCHPGNVAVAGFEVSGFVDCNHIAIAPRIFDLADFLVHLIKWDIGNEANEAVWLAHFQELVVGYEAVSPLARRERTALFYALVGIPLIFIDFFLQSGQPELTRVELNAFAWLLSRRQEIMSRLETR